MTFVPLQHQFGFHGVQQPPADVQTDLQAQTIVFQDHPANDCGSLKSPVAMPSVFPQPLPSTVVCASDPETCSPTSSVSTMGSTGPDSPPTRMAAPPSKRQARPSPPRSLPLRSLDFNTVDVPTTEQERPQTIPKPALSASPQKSKPKNVKNLRNLAVRTNIRPTALQGPPLATAQPPATFGPGRAYRVVSSPSEHGATTPSSPSRTPAFPPLRTKVPMALTIQTPTSGTPSSRGPPLTPLSTRVQHIRHYRSSPSLKSALGMPPPPPCAPIEDFPQPGMPSFEEEEMDAPDMYEPNFEIPQSQEEEQDGYPDGPIRIFESGIDLYFEPTKEIASRYDVVINVASEVPNPFDPNRAPPSLTKFRANRSVVNDPIEVPTSPALEKTPEYIHIPWEHNTEIVEDLKILVQLMKNRVLSGKKILVHCQCGVSRSASLIVAYGMYQLKTRAVQAMYNAVKRRSRWICPNMSLIMQLQEFHNVLNSDAGLSGHVRRSSDDTTVGQTLTLPASFGVPVPLRTAPPRSSRQSAHRPFFDLSVPPPPPLPAMPSRLRSVVAVGDSEMSDVFQSRPGRPTEPSEMVIPEAECESSQPASPEVAQQIAFAPVNPESMNGIPFSYMNPGMGRLTSPRTDTFALPLQQIHNSVTNTLPTRQQTPQQAPVSESSVSPKPRMMAISPKPDRTELSPGFGFGSISQNSALFRRKRPAGNINAPSPGLGINKDDPRSPVQNQHGLW